MDNLFYVPLTEITRIRKSVKDPIELCAVLGDIFRLNSLYMIERAGSGHVGTSFSSVDIVTWLWIQEMINPNEVDKSNSDIYFSSKGHDAPALYSVLIGTGRLDFELIHKLRRLGGLPGHPDVETPFIVTNTGALGMGVSKAMGMAKARRMEGKSGRIFVMLGDGELQEGAFWESLQPAKNGKFGEITAIVDHNKIQSDTWIKDTSDLGNLEAKFKAFGWEVARCDGHDVSALAKTFKNFKKVKNKPKILIADTVKGKGVSAMEEMGEEGYYKFHSGAVSFEDYQKAFDEIYGRVNKRLGQLEVQPVIQVEPLKYEARVLPKNPQKLIAAYGDELVKLARKRKDIIAMDADLVLDTGLIPFKNEFPNRYIECGIAEQHMVSMAGGLALQGKLPIVHSFACFLSTRPNEQIYNNATEKTKIIYVGSLAGLLPAGPGHSHQSVRDISTLGSIPGLVMIEPCNEQETRMALRWAAGDNKESTYIRLVSIPLELHYNLPKGYQLREGVGVELVKGRDAAVVSYGSVMLAEACRAAEELKLQGFSLTVINLPWLNIIDERWVARVLKQYKRVITLDDHNLRLGQGMQIAAIAQKLGITARIETAGLDDIPACGQNSEVLKYHKLDAESLVNKIRKVL